MKLAELATAAKAPKPEVIAKISAEVLQGLGYQVKVRVKAIGFRLADIIAQISSEVLFKQIIRFRSGFLQAIGFKSGFRPQGLGYQMSLQMYHPGCFRVWVVGFRLQVQVRAQAVRFRLQGLGCRAWVRIQAVGFKNIGGVQQATQKK